MLLLRMLRTCPDQLVRDLLITRENNHFTRFICLRESIKHVLFKIIIIKNITFV